MNAHSIPTIDAGLSAEEVQTAGRMAAAGGVQTDPLAELPKYIELQARILERLRSPTPACVLRGTRFKELPADQVKAYLAELAALCGSVSDSNVSSARSGDFVDEVRPSDPGSRDVTFQLGAIEVHSDESSKKRPEDVVGLWCDRPAIWGGSSLLWRATDLIDAIATRAGGARAIETLRDPSFLFGGKLRRPARLVRAPILFGGDGIRFRLGTIMDAADITGRALTSEQMSALEYLAAALSDVQPLEYNLQGGDALIWLNRRMLHSRTDFSDRNRLLYRTRCFNDELSNSGDDRAEWAS